MKTFMASPATIDRKWYVVDATDMTLRSCAADAPAAGYPADTAGMRSGNWRRASRRRSDRAPARSAAASWTAAHRA